MLKFEQVNMVEVQDFDDLVRETYGLHYSFQQQDGCKPQGTADFKVPCDWADESDFEATEIPEEVNGLEMGVSFAAWLARDPKKPLADEEDHQDYYLELFYERNFYPSLEMVTQDLYKKGLIPAGEYTINIDW